MRQARQDESGEAFACQMPFDLVGLRPVAAERRTKADLDAAARGHNRLVEPLAARRARAVAADQRLAQLRQARYGQTQVQAGIADDDDAAWHVTSCLDHDVTSDSPWPLFGRPRRT